jgi:hypothetical protein
MTEALVIGLSHSAAIAEALMTSPHGEGVTVKRLESRNRPFEKDTITIEQALDTVAGLPDRAMVFLAMLGTGHNLLGLLRSGPDFDFLVGASDRPDPLAQERIPQRALACAFEEYLETGRPIEKIRAVARVPVVLLSAPPPKESSQFMLDYLMRRAKREKYGRSVERAGIERPDSRLKMWALESRVTAKWAQDRGIGFLPAPEKCFNSEGFLARKYYANDATHANAAYGALVLDQIRSSVQEHNRVASNG